MIIACYSSTMRAKRYLGLGQEPEVRKVKLPVGWEGLSLKSHEGRILVSEVPKAPTPRILYISGIICI